MPELNPNDRYSAKSTQSDVVIGRIKSALDELREAQSAANGTSSPFDKSDGSKLAQAKATEATPVMVPAGVASPMNVTVAQGHEESVSTAAPGVLKVPQATPAKVVLKPSSINLLAPKPGAPAGSIELILPADTDFPSFDLTPEEQPEESREEMPGFDLIGDESVIAPQDSVRELIKDVPERHGPAGSSPYIHQIKTDVIEESITIPDPVSYNESLRAFPNVMDISPLVVCSVMTNMFDKTWVAWEPETIRQEIASHNLIPPVMKGTIKEEILFDQIFAIQLIYSHSGVMDFWNMFEKVTKALNGIKVNMQVIQSCHPREAVFATRTIKALREDLKTEKFGSEVLKYIAACCFQNGFLAVPGDLKDAQEPLNTLMGSEEYNSLAEALWNAEHRLYSMTEDDFDKTVSSFEIVETPQSIQTMKNLSVIHYVREKGAMAVSQMSG